MDESAVGRHRSLCSCRARSALLLCWLVAMLPSCCKIPSLPTLKVMMNGRVSAELPPVHNACPVVEMPLPGSCSHCDASKIAIIDVDGLLINSDPTGPGSMGENPVSLFRERLDAAARDPQVKAVVVRINSPGGGVTATDIMWHNLADFKQRCCLPVVACVLDVGAGGAYYLATAADQIFAHPTSITGGIGVILNVYNLQDAMAQFNVIGTPVKSGKHIDLGTPISALTEERKQMLQDMADEFHARFRRIVSDSRAQVDPADNTNFDGRVFTAQQAVNRGLIDHVGYLEDAIQWCRTTTGEDHVRVVLYHRPNDPARTAYALTPNVPWQGSLIPLSLPGLDRSRLPGFLYLWQQDPTLEKLGGR
jgi:protease-4